MASTSMSLGKHWEVFVQSQVSTGRYSSASEVIRDALRQMEERNNKLEALRKHVSEGLAQADRGELSEYSRETLLEELRS